MSDFFENIKYYFGTGNEEEKTNFGKNSTANVPHIVYIKNN